MSRLRYGDHNYKAFLPPSGYQGALPRRTRYGYDDAYEIGLTPVTDKVDVLAWEDLKEAINDSHEKQTQPIYHQHNTWAPEGFRWNQDGLPYCWAWSLAATFMDLRATENKETVMLAPVSMGWLVNWRQNGYYLDDSIRGLRERGIAPADAVGDDPNSTNRDPDSYDDDWKEKAKQFRLVEVWDTDTRASDKYIIQQIGTILTSGRSGYFAINSMGHAMSMPGIWWDESKYLNVRFGVRNSHNESDIIETDGARWVPDEFYGMVSSVLT
jgi:hypothetical protein